MADHSQKWDLQGHEVYIRGDFSLEGHQRRFVSLGAGAGFHHFRQKAGGAAGLRELSRLLLRAADWLEQEPEPKADTPDVKS